MRAPRFAALAALVAAAACRHGKAPEPSRPPPAAAEGTEKPRTERPPPTAGEKGGVPPEGDRPRVPASPDALLAEGAVEDLQQALAARGFLAKHETGVLDDPTTAALREFQEQEGLAATGFPDRETVRRLGIDPEEAYGRVREEVKGEGK